MSYTKLIKQWSNDHKKKMKLERIEYLKEQERKAERKAKMFWLLMKEEKAENERLEKEYNERVKKVSEFLYEQGKILSYRHWLTLRDILTLDHYQIESDLSKGKITNKELEQLKQLALQCDNKYQIMLNN